VLRAISLPTVGLGPKLDRWVAAETRQQSARQLAAHAALHCHKLSLRFVLLSNLLSSLGTQHPRRAKLCKTSVSNYGTHFEKLCKYNSRFIARKFEACGDAFGVTGASTTP
jgi:hypothetical protein